MMRQTALFFVGFTSVLFFVWQLDANAEISAFAPTNNPSVNLNASGDSDVLTPTTGAQTTATTTPTIIEQINQLREKNQIEAAKSLAEKYLQTNPKDLDVMLLLGLINYQQQNYASALNIFQKILQQRPQYLDAKLGIIRIKVIQKKYTEAKQLLQEAKQTAPNNQQVQDVENFYLKATQPPAQSAKDPQVLNQIKLLRSKNKLKQAAQTATTYLKTHPTDADVRLYLGLIYFQQSQFDAAETAFDGVLAQVPNYTDAKIGLFRVKMAQRQRKQAYALLQEIKKEAPNNPELPALQKLYQASTQSPGAKPQKKKSSATSGKYNKTT